MEFETVLNSELGEFGKYQLVNILLLTLPALTSGILAGDYVFTAGRLPLRCAVPECDTRPAEFEPPWILNAVPSSATGFDDCSRYAARNATAGPRDTCPPDLFDRDRVVPCEGYVFARTDTAVYDFGLACREWLRALAGTLNSLGAMVALPLAGYVSDSFGRRVSIVFFAFNVALVGLLKSFSVNYIMYVILQFMHTAIGGGLFSAAYILATELVGPSYRVRTSAAMSSSFALGQALLGGAAAAARGWRELTRMLFVPVFALLAYRWLVAESHRWLLSKNKTERAKETLEQAARWNGKEISENTLSFLLTAIPRQSDAKHDVNSTLLTRVLRSPAMLRRCLTTPVYWVATTFIYYGLSINSVSLSGSIYVNYILTSLIEIPGYWTAYMALDRVGRKPTLFAGYMLCSICCVAFSFTPQRMYSLSLVLYLTGKFSTGLVFTSLYLFTSELYPTRNRHSFLGFSSMLGRIGSVVAPLTPPLMQYWTGLPSMLFALMAALAGLLVLTQPETRGRTIPDTFEEAEKIGVRN